MKQLRNAFTLLLIAAVSVQLVSCLDDDDSTMETLTEEDYSTYLTSMSGLYTGDLIFWNDTLTSDDKEDTVSVAAYVKGAGDSIISVSVPAWTLVKAVEDDELRWILYNMEDVTLEIKFYLYYQENGYLILGIYPQTVTAKMEDAEGVYHDVEFTFYTYSNYNGWFVSKYLYAAFFMTKIEVDGDEAAEFSIGLTTYDDSSIYVLNLTKYS